MKPEETEGVATAPTGPGARLKSLREAQGLDLSRVAALLHLGEDKLEALEADQYDKLPGSVFVQGYLRNYARLLDVPAEPLLAAFHELHGSREPLPELHIAQVSHEVGSGHLLVRLITWGIVIGLIALLVIWWRGYLQWPTAGAPDDEASLSTAGETGAVPEGMLPELPPKDDGGVPDIDAEGEGILRLPPQEEALPEEEAAAAPQAPPAAGSETPPAPVAEPAREAPAPAPTPVPVAAPAQVELRFDGVSWVKILDAGGKFKLQGEMKPGTRRVLGGVPPYRLVLGNAHSVTIRVDGEPFDLAPYIRGNVARFTLDPR